MSTITVKLDRDSVCAGDDVESHECTCEVDDTALVLQLLETALTEAPLAMIAGGNATWFADTREIDWKVAGEMDWDRKNYGYGTIAVLAQQWPFPKLLVPLETTVAQLFEGREPKLKFRYWAQADPNEVFEALREGKRLPGQ